MLLTRHQDQVKARANPRIFDVFGDRVICGDDDIVGRGKPTPDIFLIAAKHGLGIHNTDEGRAFLEGIRNPGAEFDDRLAGHEGDVLVFDDAVPGVQAGLAAGMKGTCSCAYSTVVWVPDANVSKGISNFQLRAVTDQGPPVGAHQQIGSLLEFRPEEWGLPPFEDA